MKTLTQLAAESRGKIGEIFLAPGEKFSVEHSLQIDAIIQTAIEEATKELREEVRIMTNQCVQLRQESRDVTQDRDFSIPPIPPHASEPWIGSIGGLISCGGNPVGNALTIEDAKQIADAHNVTPNAKPPKP